MQSTAEKQKNSQEKNKEENAQDSKSHKSGEKQQDSDQSVSGSKQKRRGYRRESRSRSPVRRRFDNVLERWHYQKCSEIKIHFYVKNLYIGNQSEDAYLHFIRDRVQKAGQCEIIQISGKNREEQTIDVAIGMRYDQDAKLIYIGKKHINLASKFQVNKNKQICPVISPIFEILLEKNDELDKEKLDKNLRRQRFGGRRKGSKGSSSSKSGSRTSSKPKSSASSLSHKSRSRSKSKRKAAPQSAIQQQEKVPLQAPQIKPQLPLMNQSQSQIQQSQKPPSDLQPALLQPQKQASHQKSTSAITTKQLYRPVMLQLNDQPTILEQIQIFMIPKEFQLVECLQAIQEIVKSNQTPEGQFKIDKSNKGDQIFEYLEVSLDNASAQKMLSLSSFKIKEVPVLVCQRPANQTFRETLRPFQLFVNPAQRVTIRVIYNYFKKVGEIVAFYNIDSQIRDAEDFIIIYSSEQTIRELRPPNQIEVQKDQNTKVFCSYRYLESIDIQFDRPPFSQTLYAQTHSSIQKPQIQAQQSIQSSKPLQQDTKQHQQQTIQTAQQQTTQPQNQLQNFSAQGQQRESSQTSSSSNTSSRSKSSNSVSSGSKHRRYQGGNRYGNRNYENRRRNYNNYGGRNYQRNNNYRQRGNNDEDRRRGNRQYQG